MGACGNARHKKAKGGRLTGRDDRRESEGVWDWQGQRKPAIELSNDEKKGRINRGGDRAAGRLKKPNTPTAKKMGGRRDPLKSPKEPKNQQ